MRRASIHARLAKSSATLPRPRPLSSFIFPKTIGGCAMADTKTFGVMLFEGFEVLDVFGPVEAFGILAASGKCRVLTVAERAGAVTSAQGPKVIADFGFTESGFSDCPPIDILLVPGGIGTRREVTNHAALEWLIAHAEKAEIVASVCT